MPRQNQIQFRKGTYSQWDAQSSTVLASGEPGFITDFNKLKIGDGSTQWGDLAAINDALTTLVYNGTASTIPKMSVVYINGAQGDMPSIRLSIASGEMTSSKTYGITTNAISAGGTGMVVVDGALKNLNTSPAFDGVTPGTTLWLSPTVSGGITTTKPSGPNHMVSVGNLIRIHNQQGIINVKIQNGFELEELHNVAVSGVSDGQFLYYNSSSGLWQPNANIYSSGNSIGIRTSSPYGTFDVYGNIFVGENVNGKLMIGDDSYGGELGILTNVDEALAIKYNDGSFRYGESLPGASDSIVVASDKNIGIGTSTPFSKLHIAGDTSCDGALKITYADTNIGDNNGTDLTPWKTIINDGTINTYNNGGFGFFGQGYNITLNGNGGDTGGASLSVNGSINCSSGIINNNLTIGGNLIVNGTTVTANVDSITIEDPIITLGLASGNIITNNTLDRGLALIRATGLTAFMGWDTSASQFVMLSSGVASNSSGNYDAGTYGNLAINNLSSNVINSSRININDGVGTLLISAGAEGDVRFQIASSGGLGLGYNFIEIPSAPFYVDSNGNINNGTWNASTIAVNKGGTGRTTYSNGQLLIGSGTSLVANTLTAGTGISITNGSGTITINTSGLQTSLTNPVTGTGTNGKLPKWNSSSTLTDSILSESSTVINIAGSLNGQSDDSYLSFDANARRIGITKKGGFTGKFTYGSGSLFAIAQSNVSTIEATNTFTDRLVVDASGNVGVGTTTPGYKLQVAGSFGATTKSFRIDHPSKSGWNLEYGSLESPYHGVRLTGRGTVIKGVGVVSLPSYLKDLIHDDTTLNIQITNIKHGKTIYLEEIDLKNDQFIVKVDRAKSLGELEFFWTLSGVRKDVDHLVVEKRN